MHVVETLKPCVKEIFGVYKKNMTFGEMSNYSDQLFSKLFHGMDIPYDFQPQEVKAVIEAAKWINLKTYLSSPYLNSLMISVLLLRPINIIDEIVYMDLVEDKSVNFPKY